MDIKRTISVSFLLFANMVILAHSVVFHHHDCQLFAVICAENHNCNENAKQKNHCDHENHAKNSCCVFENCLLSKPFTKADDFKLTKPIINNFDIFFIYTPANQTIIITDLTGLPFRQRPYLLLFYSDFISQPIGLRAPPAC